MPGSSSEPEPVSSVSGMSDIAACPPSPTDDHPSPLPLPTLLPSPVSNSSLLVHVVPALVCQLLYCMSFSGCYTLRLKCFIFCVCIFMYYLSEKYYKSVTLQYSVANCASWVPTLTSLDLQMCSWIRTCSFTADLLYCSLFSS